MIARLVISSFLPTKRKGFAQVVRPNKYREDSLPKGELQVSDGKKPRREPHAAGDRVMLNFYFIHVPTSYFFYCPIKGIGAGASEMLSCPAYMPMSRCLWY